MKNICLKFVYFSTFGTGTILLLIISKFDGWALIGTRAAIRTNTVHVLEI